MRLKAARQRFQPVPASADQPHAIRIARQDLRTGGSYGARRSDDGHIGAGERDPHLFRGNDRAFHGGGDGVGVAGGHRDVEPFGQRHATVAHDGAEGAETDDAGAQLLGHAPALLQLAVDELQRELQELPGCQRAADEPAFGFGAGGGADAGNMGRHNGIAPLDVPLDGPGGQQPGDRDLSRHVSACVDGMYNERESLHDAPLRPLSRRYGRCGRGAPHGGVQLFDPRLPA